MEERLTCLEEKLSSIQLSLEMLPDLLTRYDEDDDFDDEDDDGDNDNFDDGDDYVVADADDFDDAKGACVTNSGRVGEVGEGMEGSCFLRYHHQCHHHYHHHHRNY